MSAIPQGAGRRLTFQSHHLPTRRNGSACLTRSLCYGAHTRVTICVGVTGLRNYPQLTPPKRRGIRRGVLGGHADCVSSVLKAGSLPARGAVRSLALTSCSAVRSPFFQRRVIVGRLEHLFDGHPVLQRPSEQMGEMLALRCKHFRAEKSTGSGFRVNVQQSLVPQQDARTALVLEVHPAGREAARSQRTKSAPDDADCGIRKHHSNRRAAQTGLHRLAKRDTRGVVSRDASFVGRLVQQRDGVARVAGDKDRTARARVSVRTQRLRGRRMSRASPWRRA